jgi:Flp pilus assembly protein TadD
MAASALARCLLGRARMARMDSTAMWFERGEDAEAMAETPSVERRQLPMLAWVGGAVVAATLVFGGLIAQRAHAARTTSATSAPAVAAATATVERTGLASLDIEPAAKLQTSEAPASAAASTTMSAPATTTLATATHAGTTTAAAKASTVKINRAAVAARGPRVAPEVIAGENQLRRGHPAQALSRFQQAITRDADDVRALRGACVSLSQLGRLNDAARVCRRALERAPGDVETRRTLATIYYSGGAYKWSASEWRRVVEQAPHDVRARRALRDAEARAKG